MTQTHRTSCPKNKAGQIMVIYGLLLPVLFFFMGLGVDTGLMYLTKAKLSRSVDGVALRLARKYSAVESERRNIALSIMQANYGGFLSGATWTSSGSLTDSTNGQTMTATSTATDAANQVLTVNTKSSSETSVVTVKVTAEVDHYTFFMPLANVKKVHFTDTATAERFPACNILILDNSGSMTGNGGSDHMGDAVIAFLNEFDEDRDYLLMVGFSYTASVLWPPANEGTATDANGNVYVKPSRGFITGTSGATTFSKTALAVADDLPFAGNTNAASGLRLAIYNADVFYHTLSELAKTKIKFNYVFMTDGQFNAAPTYVRGYGFGYTGKRTYTDPNTHALVGTYGDAPEKGDTITVTNMPSWHWFKPVYNGKLTSGGGEYQSRDTNDYVFKWYQTNGTVRASYNLNTKINSAAGLNLGTSAPTPCVQAYVCNTSPGQSTLFFPFSAVANSQVSSQPSSNDTVSEFNHYSSSNNNGKAYGGGWSSSIVPMSYYYKDFTFPSELTDPVPSTIDLTKTINTKDNTDRYWKEWYSFLDNTWHTNAMQGTDTKGVSILNVPNWTALANIAYARNLEKATFYAVGFDEAEEEIMRNMANQKADGTAFDATEMRGKYYKVTNASDLTTTFRDIARQIAVRLSE